MPPAGQVGMLIGTQLTDVVETANASTSANKTFLPLGMNQRAYARRYPHDGSHGSLLGLATPAVLGAIATYPQ